MLGLYGKYRRKNHIAFLLGVLLSLSLSAFAASGDGPGHAVVKLEPAGRTFDALLKDHMGMLVRKLTLEETRKYNLKAGQGVAIVWLEPSGSLKRAGFELGDVILEVNARRVDSLNRLVDLVSALKSNERITLLAIDHRTGQRGYVEVLVR